MTSTANRGVTETFKTVVRLIGVLHYSPTIKFSEILALIFLPHLAWSIPSLRKYSLAVIGSSKEARAKDPSIKDVFEFFASAKIPETGKLALSADSVRRNTANFIIAGTSPIHLNSALSSDEERLRHNG